MDMAELGAANFVKKTVPSQDRLSQRQAYLLFGEARVKAWVRGGVVSAQRAGASRNSRREYSRAELMAANESEKFNSIVNR